MARTSSIILNNSGENEHPYLVPDHRGKTLRFSPLRIVLAVDFSYMDFIMSYIPSKHTWLRGFTVN